jgi:hypothetical protein
MSSKVFIVAVLAVRWLAHRPAYMLLTAEDEALANQSPGRFGRAWFGIMLLSLIWGACSTVLWSWTWGLFGDFSGIPLMPVVVVLVVGLMGLYARCLLALAESLVRRDPRRSMAVSVIVAVWVLMLLGLKSWNPDFPHYLPYVWQWTRPRMMFRPLLLAPIWGGWAMLLAVQFCRPTERSEPAVAAFARGCGPLVTTVVLAALLLVTVVYFNHLPWTQLSISATAIATAAVGGVLLCRRWAGLCRTALLATNMLTQIAFVLAYLANR